MLLQPFPPTEKVVPVLVHPVSCAVSAMPVST
jgi:hypothetical protein